MFTVHPNHSRGTTHTMVQVIICYAASGTIKEHHIDAQMASGRENSAVSRDLVNKLGLTVLSESNKVTVQWQRPGGKVVREVCHVEDESGQRFVLGRAASQYLVAETGNDDTLVAAPGSEPATDPR